MATTKKQWDYKLTQEVSLVDSAESGTIIGRAQFLVSNPQYYVRYVDGTGCLVKAWFDEVDLEPCGGPISSGAED